MSANHRTKVFHYSQLSTAEQWLTLLSGVKPVNHQTDARNRQRLSTAEQWLTLLSGVKPGNSGQGKTELDK